MNYQTDDVRIKHLKPLIPPAILMEEYPLHEHGAELISNSRAVVECLHGRDDRLVVVVGPCSIHDSDAACEYAEKLSKGCPGFIARSVNYHARIFRKAAHHRRLEGLDQRSLPRQQLRH